MRKRSLTAALLVLSVPPLGGAVAAAAARSVSTRPQPTYVSNYRAPQVDDKGGARPAAVSDDPVTHDVVDDHGGHRGHRGRDG